MGHLPTLLVHQYSGIRGISGVISMVVPAVSAAPVVRQGLMLASLAFSLT